MLSGGPRFNKDYSAADRRRELLRGGIAGVERLVLAGDGHGRAQESFHKEGDILATF